MMVHLQVCIASVATETNSHASRLMMMISITYSSDTIISGIAEQYC